MGQFINDNANMLFALYTVAFLFSFITWILAKIWNWEWLRYDSHLGLWIILSICFAVPVVVAFGISLFGIVYPITVKYLTDFEYTAEEEEEPMKEQFPEIDIETSNVDVSTTNYLDVLLEMPDIPNKEEVDMLFHRGDIDALLERADAFNAAGDTQGKIYCLKCIAAMAPTQTDSARLNKCLYGIRNFGINLANESDKNLEGFIEPQKRAFALFKFLIDEYPNERQAMFARCDLGAMYYDERYIEYSVPHNPDEGISLMRQWEQECSRVQALSTVPEYCLRVGSAVFSGTGSRTRPNFLPEYSDELEFAQRVVRQIPRDARIFFNIAVNLYEAIAKALARTEQIRWFVGAWEWRVTWPQTHYLRFDFADNGHYRYRSSQGADTGADMRPGYYLTEDYGQIYLGASGRTFRYEIVSDDKLKLFLNPNDPEDATNFTRL